MKTQAQWEDWQDRVEKPLGHIMDLCWQAKYTLPSFWRRVYVLTWPISWFVSATIFVIALACLWLGIGGGALFFYLLAIWRGEPFIL